MKIERKEFIRHLRAKTSEQGFIDEFSVELGSGYTLKISQSEYKVLWTHMMNFSHVEVKFTIETADEVSLENTRCAP